MASASDRYGAAFDGPPIWPRARARVLPYCVISYESVEHCEAAGEEIKARANAKRSWIDYPLHRHRETTSLAYEVIEVLISPETLWRLQSRRI